MRLTLAELGLDEEVVELDYRASFAFGIAYERRAESVGSEFALEHERASALRVDQTQELLLLAASSFRRAGASALLLGMREKRIDAFSRASRLYETLRLPYAVLMSGLAGDGRVRNPLHFWLDFSVSHESEAENIYLFLQGWPKELSDLGYRLLRLSEMANVTLGVFELPLRDYVNLAAALQSDGRLDETLRPFIAAYDEGVRKSSSRKRAWKLLAQRMLPAEPDIFGLLAILSRVIPSTRVFEILNKTETSPLSRKLLFGCLENLLQDTNV